MARATGEAKRPKPLPPGMEAAAPPAAFTPGFFARVNQGPMEAEYEERNRDPRNWNPFPWGLVALGILVGIIFAVVNVYAALRVGIVVGASWYLLFFLGAALGWRPGTINYVGGASTAASQSVIAIAFVLPTLFLLTTEPGGAGFYDRAALPAPLALAAFFLIGGLLGVLFFQAYRHLWIVRRPLQYPGAFESTAGLLRMAQEKTAGSRTRLREHVFAASLAAVLTSFWVVLKDLRFWGPRGARRPFLDDLVGGRYYEDGIIPAMWETRPFYHGLLALDPFFAAIGWFVRLRIALVLLAGALVTHILPYFDPSAHNAVPTFPGGGYVLVWREYARLLAAAAIVGAGLVALIRLHGPIRDGLRQLMATRLQTTGAGTARLGAIVIGLTAAAFILLLIAGQPLFGALLVVPLSAVLVALLGFLAVKIAGETAIQPISPMITIGLLFVLLLVGTTSASPAAVLILALGAAAFFGTGLLVSTDLFLDTKIGHYIGNPPHRQALAQTLGIIPGILLATFLVWTLAPGALGTPDAPARFAAPLSSAFRGLATIVIGGDLPWLLILLAFGLGASVEYATRLGTAFGVGMVLQLFVPVTILLGAGLREGYERMLAPGTEGAAGERAFTWRVMAPVGVFVGASVTAVAVVLLNQWTA
jgi:uncharacterized oligopeptide transporter (OPT) family protein